MADSEISMLPATDGVTDDTLIPVYQPGATEPAQHMKGKQFAEFAVQHVQEDLDELSEKVSQLSKDTAVDAVRAQVTRLMGIANDAFDIGVVSNNKFDGVFDEEGYWDVSTGEAVESDVRKRTSKFYDIGEVTQFAYVAAKDVTEITWVVFYDSDYNRVGYANYVKAFEGQVRTANFGGIKYFKVVADTAFSGSVYVSGIAPESYDVVNYNYNLGVRRINPDKIVELNMLNELHTEMVDVRVGGDGTVYGTAGEAVRKQIAFTNEKIAMIATVYKDTSAWNPVNVIDGIVWGESGTYWDNSGNIVSTQYTAKYTALSELIPVSPEHSYYTRNFLGELKYLDANKTKIESFDMFSVVDKNQYSGNPPANAVYMALSYTTSLSDYTVNDVQVFRSTMTTEEREALPWKVTYNFSDHSVGLEKLDDEALYSISPLRGKMIVNFGDSIFGNSRPPYDISTELAKLTCATVYNCGFGGCRMAYHPSANYDAFSMTKLADAIVSGDFSVQDTAINNTSGDSLPDYFSETLALLKSVDFNAVDIVTIAYGTNDFSGVALDNADNNLDTRSFAGALRYSIETILTAFPNVRIFVCSPTYRFWMDANYAFTEDSDTKIGSASYLTTDLVEKAKQVSAEYKLPFIDNYYSIGINKFNRGQYFPTNDGTHHNLNGRRLIAAHMASELF